MTRRTAMFLGLALPAGYLPVAYLALAVHVLVAGVTGADVGVTEHTTLWHIGTVAIVLTLVQWPFYFIWVGLSRGLSFRQKAAWWIVILVLNMFAMPYFLWCKYRNRSAEGLISMIGRERLRDYLKAADSELEQVAGGDSASRNTTA